MNRRAIGRSVTGEPVEVLRDSLASFAIALGHVDPIYLDVRAARAAGHPDVVASPTYVVILTAATAHELLDNPSLELDFSRVVHGQQSVAHERRIYAGDVLTSTTTVLDIRDAGLHELMTTRSELRQVDGALVCTTESVTVSRGTAARQQQ